MAGIRIPNTSTFVGAFADANGGPETMVYAEGGVIFARPDRSTGGRGPTIRLEGDRARRLVGDLEAMEADGRIVWPTRFVAAWSEVRQIAA